jgi:type I restriction-modification system DNA methylase subunit
MEQVDFVKRVLDAFSRIEKEIEKASLEHDIRPRFVKYFIEPVLGYTGSNYRYEKKRTDITIFDENNFAVIKIETKKPSEDIDKPTHEEQAFKYEEETTRFICLTNFRHFKLWEIKKTGRELRVNLDFSAIAGQRKPIEQLSANDRAQILFLNNITRESLFHPSEYEKFDENYARIDITKDAGFRKLLERLNFIASNLLLGYTLRAFGEYKEGYGKYQAEIKKADALPKNDKNGYHLAKYRQKIEEEYAKFRTFGGFYLWKSYSGKDHIPDDEAKNIFCKESIYILLNKLLFLRICEDKGFLEKNISNGGIEELRKMLKKRFEHDVINKELLELAFKSAKGLYAHFYETGILDWFRTGDGELNELLNRVLWTLNQFDFTHVDRDILGNLYEKYLPSMERKKLGEFYTPTEVIDYILTSVGYTYSYDIETKDLLDPACGSGGFLVRATRRLISRYLMKFGKSDRKELRDPKNWKEIVGRLSPGEAKIILESVQEHIYGLDINPFACHIAEMNILFQIIDLYQKVKGKHPDYKLKRFRIYQTDSLELPAQKSIMDFGSHMKFFEEQEEIDKIKIKKFDFVVGNPPYVRVQMLEERVRKSLSENYESAFGNFDLYIVFIERGLDWLKLNGKFGYIISDQFTNREYGKKLRKFILKNSEIISIIDFARTKVFKDVTNYPAIMICRKKTPSKNIFKFISVKEEKPDLIKEVFFHFNEKEYSDRFLDIFEVDQGILNEKPWQFSLKKEDILMKKLGNNKKFLGNVSNILYGILSGKDPLYLGKISNERVGIADYKTKTDKAQVETELLKRILKGQDVRRWKVGWSGYFLLTPHINDDKFTPISEEHMKKTYSNAYQLFKKNEEEIKSRLMYGQTAEQRTGVWYSIIYYDYAKYYKEQKILTPALTNKNNFCLDNEGYFFVGGTAGVYGIVPKSGVDIKYLLGILNSKVSEYYLKKICPIKQGGYFQYSTKFMERLPIRLPETPDEKKIADQIIRRVDEILELHKSGITDINAVLDGEDTEKLCNLPKVAFSISDDARLDKVRVDHNKIHINSNDFIEMRDGKTRDFVEVYLNSNGEKLSKVKDVKNVILNIPVPKSDDVLKEVVRKGGADQLQIREKVKKLEREIDEIVYNIYGITAGEKRIIEESLK